MLTSHRAARGYLVSFSQHIFDDDFDVGKRIAKLSVKRKKSGRPAQWIVGVSGQTVIHAVFGHHVRDRLCAAFVPNLFEPAAH